MHVLVASSGNQLLENALSAAGHQVTVLVPSSTVDQRRQQNPDQLVVGITSWTDLDELAQIGRTLPDDISYIATVDEQAIVVCAYLREWLDLPGLGVQAAKAHTDKHVAKTALEAAGIPVAGHRVVRNGSEVALAAQALGWPVVVKPARGAGTVSTFVVRSAEHLDELIAKGAFDTRVDDVTGRFGAGEMLLSLNELGGFVVEEYLPVKEEFCVDLYLFEGEVLAAYPVKYSAPLLEALGEHEYDTALPGGDPDAAKVIELAVSATAVLGTHTGVAHCEVLRTADGWYFGEAGHRVGGGGVWQLYERQHRIDVPAALAALAVGQRPKLHTLEDPPILTTLVISAPPGIVTSVTPAEELRTIPWVAEVNLNLVPGQPTPGAFGSMSLAGSIVYSSPSLDMVECDAVALIEALALEVSEPTSAQGNVLSRAGAV